jgi:hypothetical integral membrane protein (TIGR02206 family)
MAMAAGSLIRYCGSSAAGAPANLPLLGPAHLAILGMIPILAAVLAAVQRRLSPGCKWLRVGLAGTLLLDTALWYGYLITHGQLTFPDHLPLELCDATLYLVIVALLTLKPAIFDLAYYCAVAGTSMALLTPDLWESFPSLSTVQFFVAHGLVVTAALYLVWSRQARPRRGSIGRTMVALNIFAAVIGTFDWVFKANYMYLRAKPENLSLLNFLGPWPWYIVASEGVAYVLFLLLYLPFRQFGLAKTLERRNGAGN